MTKSKTKKMLKLYGLMGQSLCAITGAIIGFLIGGPAIAVPGIVLGVIVGRLLEESVATA